MLRVSHAPSALVALAAIAVGLLAASPARALTPESPEVKAAVARAVAQLKKVDMDTLQRREPAAVPATGQYALIGLALISANVPKDDPTIQKAARIVRSAIQSGRIGEGYNGVYNCAAAISFLTSLDSKQYKPDIEKALTQMLRHQKDHGGFCTDNKPYGDTSMTQYATLGLWEASQAGVVVPAKAWEGVANWFVRTQTSIGGFVYGPDGPGGVAAAALQLPTTVTHSMSAGGAGSLYICGYFVKTSNVEPKKESPDGPKLPPSLKPVDGGDKAARVKVNIDVGALENAMAQADKWMTDNARKPIVGYTNYYYYGLERYQSFREQYTNEFPAEPEWYTTGAMYFLSSEQNGAFVDTMGSGYLEVDTAWGVLFLTRRTRTILKEIEDTANGVLIGGRGLPPGESALQLKQGRVVVKPLSGPADELLGIMENPNDPKFAAAVEGFGEQVVAADEAMIAPLVLRLHKLAGQGAPEARAAALTALGKVRNLDDVPVFILALDDDDVAVVKAARDALRFISRRFDETGPALNAEKADRAKAIEEWKAWYKSVRPDATFDAEP
ncbi:MAG: hypothetical protein HYS13_02590 [Planctomycetia bacterium]|nr:hypothetical protein [Planctomycetia bacterium]